MEIGDDERYQREYLYRRGGIPKGGAGHHVERMYLLRGSPLTFLGSFLGVPSSLPFYKKKKSHCLFSWGFNKFSFSIPPLYNGISFHDIVLASTGHLLP
jgi:hypothetical protein